MKLELRENKSKKSPSSLNKKDSLSYKHGLSTSWYSNGVKGSEGEYRMGIKNGIFYTWKKNGDLESKKVFKYGNIVE